MPDLGPAELLIILAVVVLIFGGGRLAELGGSLGKGIREFRKALKEDEQTDRAEAPPMEARTCSRCGAANPFAARFCSNCGAGLISDAN